MTSKMPDIRWKCSQCQYKTLYEGGAIEHSRKTGHMVSDAPFNGEYND